MMVKNTNTRTVTHNPQREKRPTTIPTWWHHGIHGNDGNATGIMTRPPRRRRALLVRARSRISMPAFRFLSSFVLCHVLCQLLLLLPFSAAAKTKQGDTPKQIEQQISALKRVAYSNPEGSPKFLAAWKQILELEPKHLEAHVLLGWSLVTAGQSKQQEQGISLLEASFDSSKVSPSINLQFPQTFMIASTIGRYRSQKNEYAPSQKFTKLALQLSKKHSLIGTSTGEAPNKSRIISTTDDGDVCLQMQLASMFDYFPNSTQAADEAIASLTFYAERLLKHTDWSVGDAYVSQFPGGAPDPYVHCQLSLFHLSFYYRADVATIASNHYEISRRGWPQLDTTADFVKTFDEAAADQQPCITRKIRLAVISAVLTEGHSNSESFGGVLSRLDRNIFEVTYVLIAEKGNTIAEFTKAHPSDRIFVWNKEAGDVADGAWTMRWGKKIESWTMDIIFYFELTMSSYARRLGMQRLAPVQVNSIGHPITSGHPSSVIQYYISWAAAELPLKHAQKHYTETLKLIPSDIVYQYYERRVLPGQISRMDGQAFGHLSRSDFGLPLRKRLYLCMQKPFKFHPEFDELVCGVLMTDVDGFAVLHRETSPANQEVFEKRLARAGCDLSRIMFLDQQPHHRLLALYRESTVVLDSYPAGGDTTTREVLEMGKPLVTLPARLLGGRWSLGYINNIGLKQSTKNALIAENSAEYIEFAVKLAKDDDFRELIEQDIRQSVPNLFHRKEAVIAWQNMFLEISPYQQCLRIGGKSGNESQIEDNMGGGEL